MRRVNFSCTLKSRDDIDGLPGDTSRISFESNNKKHIKISSRDTRIKMERYDSAFRKERSDVLDTSTGSSLSDTAQFAMINLKGSRRKDFRSKNSPSKTKREEVQKQRALKKKNRGTTVVPHMKEGVAGVPSGQKIDLSFMGNLSLDESLRLIENMLLGMVTISTNSKFAKGTSLVLGLIQLHMGESYCTHFTKMLEQEESIFSNLWSDFSLDSMTAFMKQTTINWEMLKENKAFPAMCTLLATFMAYKYGGEQVLTMSLGAFSLMTIKATDAAKDGKSLIDSVVKTLNYVLTSIKMYVTTGKFSGFLFSDEPINDYISEVAKLTEYHIHFMPGNLLNIKNVDSHSYQKMLQQAIERGNELMKVYTGLTRQQVVKLNNDVRRFHTDFQTKLASGQLRTTPLAFVISGSSGVGKSTFQEQSTRSILAFNGFAHSDEFICYAKLGGKHGDNRSSIHTAVLADDACNTKAEFLEKQFSTFTIEEVNNAPHLIPKADLQDKGRTFALQKITSVTTNVMLLDAHKTSNMPSSILKRYLHVVLKVKPKYRKYVGGEETSMLDSDKAFADFGGKLYSDVWNIDVYHVKITPIARNVGDAHRDDEWKFVHFPIPEELCPGKVAGPVCKDIDIYQYLKVMKIVSKKHFETQGKVIDSSAIWNKSKLCNKCGYLEGSDLCCAASISNSIVPHAFEIEKTNVAKLFGYDPALEFQEYDVIDSHCATVAKTLTSYCIETTTDRRRRYDDFMKERQSEFGEIAKTIIHFFFRTFDAFMEQHATTLREMIIPKSFDDSTVGPYISFLFRRKETELVGKLASFIDIGKVFVSGLHIGVTAPISKPLSLAITLGSWYCTSKYPTHTLVKGIMNTVMGYRKEISEAHSYYKKFKDVWCRSGVQSAVKRVALYSGFQLISHTLYGRSLFHPTYMRIADQILLLECMRKTMGVCIAEMHKWNMTKLAPQIVTETIRGYKKDESSLTPAHLVTLGTLMYSTSDLKTGYEQVVRALTITPQGLFSPSQQDVVKRDSLSKFDNQWFRNAPEQYLQPLPTSTFRTYKEVVQGIDDNVWLIRKLRNGDQNSWTTNCVAMQSGIVLVPWHFAQTIDRPTECVIIKHNKGNIGNMSYKTLLDPTDFVKIDGCDAALFSDTRTGDVKSIHSYLPTGFHDVIQSKEATVSVRASDGHLHTFPVSIECATRNSTSGYIAPGNNEPEYFPGLRYMWSEAEAGTCMSPIVIKEKKACISGFHIGQCSVTKRSYAVTLTQNQYDKARGLLYSKPSVQPMHAPGDYPNILMGKKVLEREIKSKSCFIRMDDPHCYIYGSGMNPNRASKSSVRRTAIDEVIRREMNVHKIWDAPKFKGRDGKSKYAVWEDLMKKWTKDRKKFPRHLQELAVSDYMQDMKDVMDRNYAFWSKEVRELSFDEAVNGIPGKRFIDALNMNTSVGPPHHGKKSMHAKYVGSKGVWQDFVEVSDEQKAQVIHMENEWENGRRCYPLFNTCLKDSPTPIDSDKVRGFQAMNMSSTIAMRKNTLPINRFLQLNPLESEIAVGINPYSSDWDELAKHLLGDKLFSNSQFMALDYSGFDTGIDSDMIGLVGKIYCYIGKYLGMGEIWCKRVQGIFTDLQRPNVDFNGDILELFGGNPSGNPITVFINSIVNSLYMRMFFHTMKPGERFKTWVALVTYGDDLVAAMKKRFSGFNMIAFREFLNLYNIKITSADKTSTLERYVRFDQIDFLKRRFIWSREHNSYVGPLDELSIIRPLCCYMKSDTDAIRILAGNIDGSLNEWFFYGKSKYELRRNQLIKICEEFGLTLHVRTLTMSFKTRMQLWKKGLLSETAGHFTITAPSDDDSESVGLNGLGINTNENRLGGPPQSSPTCTIVPSVLASYKGTETKNNINVSVGDTIKIPTFQNAEAHSTLNSVVPHSFKVVNQEIMEMKDGSENQTVSIPSTIDETRTFVDNNSDELGSFLERPLRIAEYTWTPSITFFEQFDPWSLFMNNPRNINRLNNFNLFRGKMNLKFLINGNSFYYGRLMVSYQPFEVHDNLTKNRALVLQDNVQMSQFPRVFLDPTTSQGAEMTLPFFWYEDYVDLGNTEYEELGKVTIRVLNQLKHTSGDTTLDNRINISVYAWLSDVSLEAPTAANLTNIIPQAKDERDEAKEGPVTKVATAVEAAMNVAKRVPLLAPYATPAQTGASMLKSVAKMYGWCNPTILDPAAPMSLRPTTGGTAVTNMSDSSQKLTADAKNELSIDPRIFGLGSTDELDISHIVTRESYLTKFGWAKERLADSLLWNCAVSPSMFASNGAERHLTAVAGACVPFKYWNGTMKYRFQIVASAFHRGRLAIVYDPQYTPTVREDNVVFTEIVDIATNRDFTVSIGPHQSVTLMERANFSSPSQPFGTSRIGSSPLGNGTISVWVLNELTLPDTASTVDNDIEINVFVSAHDDMEFFLPDNEFRNFSVVPQSLKEDDVVQKSEAYGSTDEITLGNTDVVKNKRNLVYAGECVKSFRMMLKRFYPMRSVAFPSSTLATNIRQRILSHTFMPMYRGGVPGAVDLTLAGDPYNYVDTTLITYLLPAFQAHRGSTRWKIVERNRSPADDKAALTTVALKYQGLYDYAIENFGTDPRSSMLSVGFNAFSDNSRAMVMVCNSLNPMIEYEVPYYANVRFTPGKPTNFSNPSFSRQLPLPGATISLDAEKTTTSALQMYVGAGEDFTMSFFTGWPVMYYVTTVPPPQ